MPPMVERAHKCDVCKNELLIDIGPIGAKNAVLYSGGPEGSPVPITNARQWACYMCVECRFVGPWKKQFAGGSRELVSEYKELLDACKAAHAQNSLGQEQLDKMTDLIDSQKSLGNLPGASSMDEIISAAIEPLKQEIVGLQEELATVKKTFTKQRGGRPPGCIRKCGNTTRNEDKICDDCKGKEN